MRDARARETDAVDDLEAATAVLALEIERVLANVDRLKTEPHRPQVAAWFLRTACFKFPTDECRGLDFSLEPSGRNLNQHQPGASEWADYFEVLKTDADVLAPFLGGRRLMVSRFLPLARKAKPASCSKPRQHGGGVYSFLPSRLPPRVGCALRGAAPNQIEA